MQTDTEVLHPVYGIGYVTGKELSEGRVQVSFVLYGATKSINIDELWVRPELPARTELYRNEDGHEVWRIRKGGKIIVDNVSSDHDPQWLKDNV
jgi:hypothetical protein